MLSKKIILVFTTMVMFLIFSESVASSNPPNSKSYLAPYLNKKYKLTSSDNFEEVMKTLGVGFLKRKLGNLANPVMELTEHDGEYTLSSESAFKDIYTKFRLGEEFEEVTADDRVVKSVITQDKNVLTQVQKGEKTTVVTREFSADQVKVVVKVDDVVSVRIYTAV